MLSYSGHIQSLVNPPGNPKAHYWTGGEPGPGPAGVARRRERAHGQLVGGLGGVDARAAGDRGPPRRDSGSDEHPPLEPAPGSYVRDLASK